MLPFHTLKEREKKNFDITSVAEKKKCLMHLHTIKALNKTNLFFPFDLLMLLNKVTDEKILTGREKKFFSLSPRIWNKQQRGKSPVWNIYKSSYLVYFITDQRNHFMGLVITQDKSFSNICCEHIFLALF